MKVVNLHAAKTHLSRLVDDAARGEDIVIAKAGRPVARLVALSADRPRRQPGTLKGKIRIAKNFDAPLPEQMAVAFGVKR